MINCLPALLEKVHGEGLGISLFTLDNVHSEGLGI